MTRNDITARVMALSVEDVRIDSATDIMGWKTEYLPLAYTQPHYYQPEIGRFSYLHHDQWRPDKDRNQARMVTDKIGVSNGWMALALLYVMWADPDETWDSFTPPDQGDCRHWETVQRMLEVTPEQETRAALIAHRINQATEITT